MAKNAELHRSPPKLTTRRHKPRRSSKLRENDKRDKARSTLPRIRSEGPGRQSGPRFSFLSRAGYGPGSRPPGVGPTMGGMVGSAGSGGGALPPKLHLNRFLGAVVVDDELDRVSRLVLRDHVAQLVDRGGRDTVGF